jgi:hypothetical protein
MTDERKPDARTEVIDAEPTHLIRSPHTPTTINDLAALKGEAVEVIEARVQVIETLRKASIRATSPADWLLFKSPEEQGGQIVGYLQDAGADRVRDLWGIEIFGISAPEKVTGNDPAVFHYIIRGSGRCKLTRQVLEEVEGGRSSTDDFCRGKTGADLELSVRKAARANLDGGITRELAGMKSVPVTEIEAAWIGTPKKIADCRRGRGFGTHEERLGARSEKSPDVDAPICPHCGAVGVYRPAKGTRAAFYGCPKFSSHEQKRWFQDAAEWVAGAAARAAAVGGGASSSSAAAQTGQAPETSAPPAGRVTPDPADAIFGPAHGQARRRREPGEEG